MNSAQAKHIVVYWGRRGGGLDLYNLFVEECKDRRIPITTSARPVVGRPDRETSMVSFFNAKAWLMARKSLLRQAEGEGIKSAIFIMSSPWDIFLGRRLENIGVHVVRIIHDANPHPGEKFPPKFWIRLLTKDCSRIVTLSNYVANQLTTNYGVIPDKVTVCSFPKPRIASTYVKNGSSSKKILLIGRGKRYQGQNLLEQAWNLLDKSDKKLVIAGKGFKPNSKHLDIEYKNWWMTGEELLSEIASSDLVVFPYTEASQSGTIPICIELGVPVLVTPVGGLAEQIAKEKNGIVAANLSPLGFANAIETALSIQFRPATSVELKGTTNLISECLTLC
jgi:glycosyltransferase involved in cell wall biosynthesis